MAWIRIAILFMLMHGLAYVCRAQAIEEMADSVDAYLRENPDMSIDPVGQSGNHLSRMEYGKYPFLNIDANHIEFNGDDWTDLKNLFGCCGDTLISIVHIGDSHIQAEGSTTLTRSLLQERYGNAGRGLIIPFKLAGTNQPRDYKVTSSSNFNVAKILKQPWPIEMGFTGISVSPVSKRYSMTVSTSEMEGISHEFEEIKIFGHGEMPLVLSVEKFDGARCEFESYDEGDALTVFLSEPVEEITLQLSSQGECEMFGILLDNFMVGVQYSAIGNNGATFSSYNNVGKVGEGISALIPNLVIVSLGTNEAFGNITEHAMYNSIDVLLRNIKRSNTDAKILLVTPAECQKSKTTHTGKKRKRTKIYQVNSKVERVRQVILKYGRENHVPTYDWYEVAGGDGSSSHWLEHDLMNTDRIHNTWEGYALQGILLYDALIDAIEQ